MKKQIYTLVLSLLFSPAFAQYTSPGLSLHDNLGTLDFGMEGSLGKKAGGVYRPCTGDTLDYARYKASNLVAINVLNGFSLGQYYDAPDTVTISGFDFYAWQTMRTSAKVTLYCHLYDAGRDSLPSGSPVRSDTIVVDSTFGSGLLSTLLKRALFQPYKTTKPYILVIENRDSVRVGVVSNNYSARDGDQEFLGCGTVGFRWYNFKNLNISGTQLDCDMALEPHVSYKIYNDFEFKDCYDYRDTVKFNNSSSPIVQSKMYNRYAIFGIERFCHYWDFGDGYRNYMTDGEHLYNSARNATVNLYTSHYALRGNQVCRDTTSKQLFYQPSEISFSGNANLCSGEAALVTATTNGEVKWFESYSDTVALDSGAIFSRTNLQHTLILYAEANNGSCKTKRRSYQVRVTATPGIPGIQNDSVCTGAKANLFASDSVGSIRWYTDSAANNQVHQGNVLEIGPLSRDTFFFVKAYNAQCTHAGSVRVSASVDPSFAPIPPFVSSDTLICLLDGAISLQAKSSNPVRWFDVPSGGHVIDTGSVLQFTPVTRGLNYRYADAFDGRCPSSRIPVKIEVLHFPGFNPNPIDPVCEGQDGEFTLNSAYGNFNWFSDSISGIPVHTGHSYSIPEVRNQISFFVLPFEQMCTDTIRHKISLDVILLGEVLSYNIDENVCSGAEPQAELQVSRGEISWYNRGDSTPRAIGNRLELGPLLSPYLGTFILDNMGCTSEPVDFAIAVKPSPDAVYDYQINSWRHVEFAARYSGKGTYLWDFDENGTTSGGKETSHRYSSDGTYRVQLIIENDLGCTDTSSKDIVINTLSVEDVENPIRIYPNPVHSVLHIQSPITRIRTCSVVDISGRTLLDQLFSPRHRHSLDMPELMPGLYLIHVELESGITLIRSVAVQ